MQTDKLDKKTTLVLKEIEKKGERFYIQSKGRKEVIKLWRISFEKGLLLHNLIIQLKPKKILELGTSVGYSTLFLVDAAKKVKAFVESIEVMQEKCEIAKSNLDKASLSKYCKIINANILNSMESYAEKIDFIFMDANKSQYTVYYKGFNKNLNSGAIIFADNILKETTNGFKEIIRQDLGQNIREYEINYKDDYLQATKL
ncbi:MAG: class I SAM-dependent methyltransferase [Candidatus ainarchaeum sp.]|nr:class I SAM-dependent methyltransferase [Candidatus ainarchaeum sp.]